MKKIHLEGTVKKRCGMRESGRVSQRESDRAKVSKSEPGLFVAKMLFVNALWAEKWKNCVWELTLQFIQPRQREIICGRGFIQCICCIFGLFSFITQCFRTPLKGEVIVVVVIMIGGVIDVLLMSGNLLVAGSLWWTEQTFGEGMRGLCVLGSVGGLRCFSGLRFLSYGH